MSQRKNGPASVAALQTAASGKFVIAEELTALRESDTRALSGGWLLSRASGRRFHLWERGVKSRVKRKAPRLV